VGNLLAQAAPWVAPTIDWHALAPEIVLGLTVFIVLVSDQLLDERRKWLTSAIAGIGLLVTLIPIATLALDESPARILFDGRYVVDDFSLVLKALFCIAGYVVILLSTTYVEEGDYYEGEYYFLLLSSVLGMVMMASARDLISIFVALELLSIPAYLLATWRKRDPKSNEAGMKYFLLGVFASAVMLYGMSLLYGVAGSTLLTDIAAAVSEGELTAFVVVGVVFALLGFAFKISAVPFHNWAPDTYEGAPTPVTAFLSVLSKAAGFVALITLALVAFPGASEAWQPLFWALSVVTMTVGNLLALRQTNIVRMLAYSSVAQGGFILMPLATAANSPAARENAITAIVSYLIIYAAMNLGAFACVLAVSRKTRSGDLDSFGGLFSYAPGLAVAMTIFLFSLAGIPPLGGWVAKFDVFRAVLTDAGAWDYVLALIGGINGVIALYYYANVARVMWMEPVPDGDTTPVKVPQALAAALAITAVITVLTGVLPQVVLRFGDLSSLVAAGG
jgi:NADH-quinone oxidoreductase subunit N